MKTRPLTAWLIQREWIGNHPRVDNPLVDIVSSRKEIPYVTEYVQRLHDLHCLTLRERAPTQRYTKPSEPPYKARAYPTARGVEISCGHNPFLIARQVKIVSIEIDPETGHEILKLDTSDR